MRKRLYSYHTADAILEFIRRHKREHGGMAPSMREIAAAVGLASTSTAHHHLATLEERGLIRRGDGKSRWIEIIEEVPNP